MDITMSYLTHPLNADCQLRVLQTLANKRNVPGAIRGQIKNILPNKNNTVFVVGDYPDLTLRKIVDFNVLFEQADIQTVLKNRTLAIERPRYPKALVWNVDICLDLKKEFGLRFLAEDFIPKRVDPSIDAVELTFVPYHPFYYGTIKVNLSDASRDSNVSNGISILEGPAEIHVNLKPSDRQVFSLLNVGDRLPTQLSSYVSELANELSWSSEKAVNNTNWAMLVEMSDEHVVLLPYDKYNLHDVCKITLHF